MTTTEQSLATREYSDSAIRTRIELNSKAGYGLQSATQAQLNTVFLLCQRYDADPLTDITLFEGRPFWTIDGRLRFMRRHPDFRGFDCRPLTRDEKEAWGYEPDDIVIEATIRTARWGDVKARGKVTRLEVDGARERATREHKRPAPIGVHPVEIAEKRALARAERAAFGQDAVPDDEEIAEAAQTVIERRSDPVRNALNAARYEHVFGTEDSGTAYDLPEQKGGEAEAPSPQQESESVPPAGPAEPEGTSQAFHRNMELGMDATSMGIKGIGHLRAKDDWPIQVVLDANAKLEEKIRGAEAQRN